MKRILLVVALAIAIGSTGIAAAADQAKQKPGAGVIFLYNDGENWLSWDGDARLIYVAGYRDGRNHGLYELQIDYADCDIAAAKKQGYRSEISTRQLVDSVNQVLFRPD